MPLAMIFDNVSKTLSRSTRIIIDSKSIKYDNTLKNKKLNSSFASRIPLVSSQSKTKSLFVTNAKITASTQARDAAIL